MSEQALRRLLAGEQADPDGGGTLSVATRAVHIADSLRGSEQELVAALDLGRRLAVVSDPTTRAVLGARVERALAGIAAVVPVVLPEGTHADDVTAERVARATAGADALVAVGAGTVNDLCKHAAARAGKPYAVFATAPSMNGYTSANAAITVANHKQSLPARVPVGVFLDLQVLAQAPPRMIRSGLGDSLCRPTAQADWLLAHLLHGQPYREAPFQLLAEDEEALLAEPAALLGGDLAAMRCLARTLALSGFGMTLCGSSHPASEGEHLISHYAEMMGDPAWPQHFHGEQIGVTTLTMARVQQRLLDGPAPRVVCGGPTETDLVAHFGAALGRSCWQDFSRKKMTQAQVDSLNGRLARDWEAMRTRLAAVTRTPAFLENVLRRAGAPCTAEELSWPRPFYQAAVRHAREIRDRYTFLDLAAESGLMEAVDFVA